MLEDPKSAKNTASEDIIFYALLGSACVKAARKMLVKLSPVVKLINFF